jgi:hypothetical protein
VLVLGTIAQALGVQLVAEEMLMFKQKQNHGRSWMAAVLTPKVAPLSCKVTKQPLLI